MKQLLFTLTLVSIPALAMAQEPAPGTIMMQNWDLNEDGQVTLEEVTERRTSVFTGFDTNEDGFLDAAEYVAFDAVRASHMAEQGGSGHGQMKKAAGGMSLAKNDNDGDGKVSRDEFVGNASKWIERLDSDDDGVVTKADFNSGF